MLIIINYVINHGTSIKIDDDKNKTRHLIIDDIIITIVDTPSIRAGLQAFCDVLQVWNVVRQHIQGPAPAAL